MPFLLKIINGEPILGLEALSLMYGVPIDEITMHIATTTVDGRTPFPAEWLQAGRRRAGEARAHTGSTHIVDKLKYWAAKDLGAAIAFVDANGDEIGEG